MGLGEYGHGTPPLPFHLPSAAVVHFHSAVKRKEICFFFYDISRKPSRFWNACPPLPWEAGPALSIP
jgi:hypothetical protein